MALLRWSNVDNGIVIDVSELKSAEIDSATLTARVGTGLNQLEAVTALAEQGLAVTTGTEGSVGLAGATLGGGFGFLTRYLGMACRVDNPGCRSDPGGEVIGEGVGHAGSDAGRAAGTTAGTECCHRSLGAAAE
ncbi:FAD-binding protein [Micromonospora sp. DPT]|uniref:FAD-binding protein n=1 Tax=Micromonospora sp. DPT TaxID=3142975 RepID=UPI003209730C